MKSVITLLLFFSPLVITASAQQPNSDARTGDSKAVRAFVTNFGGDSISVIDPESGRLIANIKTGSQPHGVAIAPDGRAVYVSNEGDGTMSIVDPARNEVVGTVKVGKSPNQLEVGADGKYVFVTLNGADSLAIVDAAARKVVKSVPVGRARHTSRFGAAMVSSYMCDSSVASRWNAL